MAARRKKGSARKGKRKGTPRPNSRPPNPVKPGEVRNPKGVNGWTKARQRVREMLAEEGADIMEVAAGLAKAGDSQAIKLLLGPLLPAEKHEHEHTGEVTVRFARKGDK